MEAAGTSLALQENSLYMGATEADKHGYFLYIYIYKYFGMAFLSEVD